jgi:hypothetical protein
MTNTKSTSRTRESLTAAEPVAARKAKLTRPAAGTQAKSEAPAKTSPNSASAVAPSPAKPKPKLVRDSFTIPKSEYLVLEGLKVRAANLTRPVKKSELLRAGVAVLSAMSDKAFLAALSGVPSLKTGRPKNSDAAPASVKGSK